MQVQAAPIETRASWFFRSYCCDGAFAVNTLRPSGYVTFWPKPLFVVAGKNDPRVPASESQQMVEIVRQNGTPVWWLLGKDEGHGFRKKKNVDYQFYATVMFIQEYLLK